VRDSTPQATIDRPGIDRSGAQCNENADGIVGQHWRQCACPLHPGGKAARCWKHHHREIMRSPHVASCHPSQSKPASRLIAPGCFYFDRSTAVFSRRLQLLSRVLQATKMEAAINPTTMSIQF
jgi:hypothetical protein